MNPLRINIEHLKADYESVTGKSFQHFFCPILHVDEDVPLTKGHIVPGSLGGTSRVLQRADVDNGFGSFFEAEAIDAIHHGLDGHPLRQALSGHPDEKKKIARRFKLSVRFEGTDEFLHASYRKTDSQPGFFVSTDQLRKSLGGLDNPSPHKAVVGVELDARSSILVTALRTSHLAWFQICGYRYVFSNEGIFVASVLRSFYERFIQPRHGPQRTQKGSLVSQQVKQQVNDYCFQFANFIRPVPKSLIDRFPEEIQRGTPDTGWFIALWDAGQVYGKISIVKLGNHCFGVMTPTITDARGWALLDLAANFELDSSFGRFDSGSGTSFIDPPSQRSIWLSPNHEDRSSPPISIRQAAQIVIDSGRMV